MKTFFGIPFTSLIYFATVFITGAAVLIFEVAAVRMLAPYFGSSLYVLSSVLTTILAALSFGYYLGGQIADRAPHPTILYLIIGSAGVMMLFLQLLSLYILPDSNQVFSITTGPLILSLTLFLVPAFLLGIDSPFVIKLLTEEDNGNHNGAVVGSTFFFSTFGSIFGSIAAGFFLIPYLGLTLTITAVSSFLILWSLLAAFVIHHHCAPSKLPVKVTSLPLLITIGIFSAVYCLYLIHSHQPNQTSDTTLYQADGFYSNIHIFDRAKDGVTYRYLKNDVNSSSAIIPGKPDLVFTYSQLADIFTVNNPEAKNYLVLGGGSYTIPRFINHTYPDMWIDIAEIEPSLFTLAHQYFELPITPTITNYEQDARVFLQSTTTQYDVIFSDVMNSGLFIPPHVSTVEFFKSFKDRLAPEGIAIVNFIGTLDTSETTLTGSMIKTIASVFPNYKLVPLRGPDYTETQNMLFILRHEGNDIMIPATEIKDYFNNTSVTADTLLAPPQMLRLDNQVVFTDNKSLIEPLIVKQFAGIKLQ
jgi:spermidine synthase